MVRPPGAREPDTHIREEINAAAGDRPSGCDFSSPNRSRETSDPRPSNPQLSSGGVKDARPARARDRPSPDHISMTPRDPRHPDPDDHDDLADVVRDALDRIRAPDEDEEIDDA